MAGSIAPQWLFQIFDDNGNIAAGAKLFSYVAGTTEPTPVYADYACTTPLENPYTANAAGRVNFWLKDGIGYRLKVEDAVGNVLCDRWPIYGAGASTGDQNQVSSAEIRAFPEALINWVEDTGNDLWEKIGAELAFRVDLFTKPYTKLLYFKSIFSGNRGSASGKFAIYGDLSTKLYEGTLPDYDSYSVVEFESPIDISGYDFLAVAMDPGVDGIPQPLMQSILTLPVSTALSRYAFAGTFQHDHNTDFPDTCPAMIATDEKYFLARWCALGVA